MSEGGTTEDASSFLQAHQTLVRTEPVVRRKTEIVSIVISAILSSGRACAVMRGEAARGGMARRHHLTQLCQDHNRCDPFKIRRSA